MSHGADLVEVQRTFKSAEAVGRFTIFNIGGNKYRLIVDIKYDKGKWKHDPYF